MLPKGKGLRKNAQELRRNMTAEERHLWYDFLKGFPRQFNRQKVIGPYIADFYCDSAKLVIEIDGSQHYEASGLSYDKCRTAYFPSLGIRVLRFSNIDAKQRFEGVCTVIEREVGAGAHNPHPPSADGTFPQGKANDEKEGNP